MFDAGYSRYHVNYYVRLDCDEQDFSSKWIDAVKTKVKDSVCARVYEEADGIRKAVPALKFARGEPFKDEHWTQVIGQSVLLT